jgi:hypothetical protein
MNAADFVYVVALIAHASSISVRAATSGADEGAFQNDASIDFGFFVESAVNNGLVESCTCMGSNSALLRWLLYTIV